MIWLILFVSILIFLPPIFVFVFNERIFLKHGDIVQCKNCYKIGQVKEYSDVYLEFCHFRATTVDWKHRFKKLTPREIKRWKAKSL